MSRFILHYVAAGLPRLQISHCLNRDIFRAIRTVKALRAGIVWVNHMQPTYVEAPWGGYKQSGAHQSQRTADWMVLMSATGSVTESSIRLVTGSI